MNESKIKSVLGIFIVLLILSIGCARKETNDSAVEIEYILTKSYTADKNKYDLNEIYSFILDHPYRDETYQSEKFGEYTFSAAMSVSIIEELRETEQEREFLQWMTKHHEELGMSLEVLTE